MLPDPKSTKPPITHTPGPWKVCGQYDELMVVVDDNEPGCAIIAVLDSQPEMEANAEFIVRACNAHEAFLSALEQFAQCDLNDENCASLEVASHRVRSIARAALAKAAGK